MLRNAFGHLMGNPIHVDLSGITSGNKDEQTSCISIQCRALANNWTLL